MAEKSANGRTRVVIVGGGCAGMAAAWELAKQPDYDIHVYEKTPRLGGKGSSTRDGDGYILEHGLHVWMGWYENAFRMMRECYAVVEKENKGPRPRRDPWRELAHHRFDDAFTPEPNVGLVDPNFHGKSVMWSVFFPPNEGRPGTPMKSDDNPFTMAAYTGRLMEMAKALVLSVVGDMPGETPGPARPDHRSRSDEILSLDMKTPPADSTAALLNRMVEMSKAGALTGAAALLQLVTILEVYLRRQNIGPKAPESTLAIAEAGVSQARKLLRDLCAMDPRLRVKTEVIDIVLTVMIGLFNERVMFRKDGLDSLNEYDYREWLLLHGATKTSVESRFIRAAYDFAFAYEDGDQEKPRLAAGVALRGGMRMFFTYRGAAFWRMRSGMGDAIFAPLYTVLNEWRKENRRARAEARIAAAAAANAGLPSALQPPRKRHKPGHADLQSPVRFHFGYELDEAAFDHRGFSLRQLTFKRQRRIEPPLQGGGWPHWPDNWAEPRRPQLTLTRRNDPSTPLGPKQFDLAVIATGIHEFSHVFVDAFKDGARPGDKPNENVHKAWARTAELTKTVATKSAQVWIPRDLYRLGWRRGSGLFTSMGKKNFDTYADMTHVLPAEARGRPARPWRSLAYFCNPLEKGRGEADVAKDLEELLVEQMDAFWPKLFRTSNITRRKDVWLEWFRRGMVRQYVRANTVGSDRYTLSVPGSTAARVSPLDPGIDNMTIAGDWTACGLDCGCVEAAVISGKLAATAISGKPDLDDIVGYDQP